MKVFKYLDPYKPDGKTAFPESQKRTGVYMIKEDGLLVYVGYSQTNLYKTMYRHFQQWSDEQYRVTYANKLKRHKYTVRIIYCPPNQALKLEGALILKYKPRDNENTYDDFEMDSGDIKVLQQYSETPMEREAPF